MFDGLINWWAIIVATIACMGLGYIWYSMPVFGRMWMNAIGKPEADLRQGALRAMLGSVVVAFVMSYVFAQLFEHSTFDYSVANGLMYAAWISVGFHLPVLLQNVLYERRQLRIFWINFGYQFVTALAVGAIIGGWQVA